MGRDVRGRDVRGRDVRGRDVMGRDVRGRDVRVRGRDVRGRDVRGRDVRGRGSTQMGVEGGGGGAVPRWGWKVEGEGQYPDGGGGWRGRGHHRAGQSLDCLALEHTVAPPTL